MPEMPTSIRILHLLRRKIIVGEYAQGQILSQSQLADDLVVSRVPVREVMPVLHQEGFVEMSPRRRSVVSTWTTQRIHDLFDARLGVEVAAAGAAARRVPRGNEFLALEHDILKSETHLQEGRPLEVALANARVHVALVAMARNELFDELMRVLGGRMAWLFYLTSGRDLVGQSHEHEAILEALRDGNARLAETLTYSHIESGRKPTLAALNA